MYSRHRLANLLPAPTNSQGTGSHTVSTCTSGLSRPPYTLHFKFKPENLERLSLKVRRQDSSIHALAWSKQALVTFHPVSKAKETFYNNTLKYFSNFLWIFLYVNVKLCTSVDCIYWCQWLILYVCSAQCVELVKKWFFCVKSDLGYGFSTLLKLSQKETQGVHMKGVLPWLVLLASRAGKGGFVLSWLSSRPRTK
jgi:hypothetical protein